jgi:uncharacterized protein YqjF (DUF2071 family)
VSWLTCRRRRANRHEVDAPCYEGGRMVMSDHTGVCPFRIERPVMVQRWETLTFLHWGFDPDAVQLPAPRGAPIVHYSPGVDVKIGRPEPC